ncbi:hypothetical protein PORCRE_1657 [Porphyromonas crevioricanis JCM 15906]|uniref:Uncharacterized protein n=1 Tax=Porphyromonas crevioricanis JCM 15906 TaxID=1305617 RepID=T1CS47_9PORP|nr:hypothetical protein PORCRE_1657 [Porphyromonas crevioricanis JCM 15906]
MRRECVMILPMIHSLFYLRGDCCMVPFFTLKTWLRRMRVC